MNAQLENAWIEAAVSDAASRWKEVGGLSATSKWVLSKPLITPHIQSRREAAYDHALKCAVSLSKRSREFEPSALKHQLTDAFACFAAEALDLPPGAIHLLTKSFLPVGTELTTWARRFDPTLSISDITQACRNVWTACGLQPLIGQPLALTPAILAYSLLYPYTDNLLDLPCATTVSRSDFCDRFSLRLSGSFLSPRSPRECSIWELVRLIEDEFPRSSYPDVYNCLLAIHQAQSQSLAQLDFRRELGQSEVLRITCAKGGTSVLADACLICGILNAQQAQFAFLWGVLLQIGDDLQDIAEDLERGSQTLFTSAIHQGRQLDSIVQQLLNFSNSVAACMDDLPNGELFFKDLLRMSWRSLIIAAVGRAHRFFSPEFVAQMEAQSAFRFEFLRARHKILSRNNGLIQRLFRIASADKSELPTRLPQPVRQHQTIGRYSRKARRLAVAT